MSIKGYKDENGNIQKYDIDSLYTSFTSDVGQVLSVDEVDENGKPIKWKTVDNVSSGGDGKAIVDVTALPTEDIVEGVFYRLLSAKFMSGLVDMTDYNLCCKCVRDLPETGDTFTDEIMSYVTGYYNIQDKKVYGYMNEELASLFGVSEGWYDFETIASISDSSFEGIITDISQIPEEDYDKLRVLVRYNMYIYSNGWKEIPYAEESEPELYIEWDGVIGDKFYLDMSFLGEDGKQLVKVSDAVPTINQLIGSKINCSSGSSMVDDSNIDTEELVGVISVDGVVMVVYSSDKVNVALGLPDGYITNGTYFLHVDEVESDDVYQPEFIVSKLIGKRVIVKIDDKFLPKPKVSNSNSNIPEPTYNDNGKFLQVVNGEAAWVNIPFAEGGSF